MRKLAFTAGVGAVLALTFLLGFSMGMNAPARAQGLVWDGSYPVVAQGKVPC